MLDMYALQRCILPGRISIFRECARRYIACGLARVTVLSSSMSSIAAHRCDVVGQFMEYVARSSVIAEAPAARVAYLGVLTSLASGPQGAQVSSSRPFSICGKFAGPL